MDSLLEAIVGAIEHMVVEAEAIRATTAAEGRHRAPVTALAMNGAMVEVAVVTEMEV